MAKGQVYTDFFDTGDTDYAQLSDAAAKIVQLVRCDYTHTMTQFSLYMRCPALNTEDLTVDLYKAGSDGTNPYYGDVLATCTIPNADIPVAVGKVVGTFTVPYEVQAGVDYMLVAYCPTASAVNVFYIYYDEVNVY